MRIAQALRDRLPRTAALLASRAVSATVVDAITWRTHLVEDPDALGLIDAAIAGEAGTGRTQTADRCGGSVGGEIPIPTPSCGLRRAAKRTWQWSSTIRTSNGVASFWGRLRITDTKILEQRLNALADTVCSNDPRGNYRGAGRAGCGRPGVGAADVRVREPRLREGSGKTPGPGR